MGYKQWSTDFLFRDHSIHNHDGHKYKDILGNEETQAETAEKSKKVNK
jgi:hypothetical protein